MTRFLILVLTLINVICGAELTVFTSSRALEDNDVSASVWYSDGSWIEKEPEREILQEGQIIREIYRDLKPGKYRIVLEPLGPIGLSYALMETHVDLKKDASESVILIAQEVNKMELPAELVEVSSKVQGPVMWDLSVRYPGFKEKFYQVRAFSDPKDFRKFIHYLRPDGEYTIGIWDKDAAKGYVFEKTFRVEKVQESDPFTAGPDTKSENDISQPEAKGNEK